MPLITSASNPRIGRVKDLHTKRGREKSGLFLMEGSNLLEVSLDAEVLPREIYYQPELLRRTPKGRTLLDRFLHVTYLAPDQRIEVSTRVVEAISDVATSQGLVSVFSLDDFTPERTRTRRTHFTHYTHSADADASSLTTRMAQRPAILILDDLADPGNMGTILRTALAADVDTVMLTPHCADCYSPKVVRAAAGAHVLLPIEVNMSWATIAERVQAHCQGESHILLAEAEGVASYYETELSRPFALIIGNEAHGSSSEAHALATTTIHIPLANGVESLNAAMATGIILYESLRQRYK